MRINKIQPLDFLGQQQNKTSLEKLPTSPALDLINQTLTAGKDRIAQLPARKWEVSRAIELNFSKDEETGAHFLDYESKSEKIKVILPDLNKLTSSNKTARKILQFVMVEAAKQAFTGTQLKQNFITFPLNQLVDEGLYSSTRAARRAFQSASDILTSMKLEVDYKHGPKKMSHWGVAVLFPSMHIVNNQCIVDLANRLDWSAVIRAFSLIPDYWKTLGINAFDLIYYIFYMARQKQNLGKNTFRISTKALCHRLMLPNPDKTKNPYRDIIEPIKTSIAEITEKETLGGKTPNLVLKMPESSFGNINEFYNNGYIEVKIKDEYKQAFLELADKIKN